MQQTVTKKSVSYTLTLRACALHFLTGRNLCLQDKDGFYFTALVSHVVISLSSGHLISRASSDATHVLRCVTMQAQIIEWFDRAASLPYQLTYPTQGFGPTLNFGDWPIKYKVPWQWDLCFML